MKHRWLAPRRSSIAEGLGIGDFIRSVEAKKTGGRKNRPCLPYARSDHCGRFSDCGYAAARVFVGRIFAGHLKTPTPDGSSIIKRRCRNPPGRPPTAPSYSVVETAGPPHAREFLVETTWKTGKARGRGTSIKAAEMMAAAEALSILRTADGTAAKRGGQK